MNLRDLILARSRTIQEQTEPNVKVLKCITKGVDYADNCSVAGKPGYVWVQEVGTGSIFQAFNAAVKNSANLAVTVQDYPKQPYKRMVTGVDWSALPPTFVNDQLSQNNPNTFGLVNHAANHEWRDGLQGSDAMNVFMRAITPLRTIPCEELGGLLVSVEAATYIAGGVTYFFDGEPAISIADYVPTLAGYYRAVLVYLDITTNSIKLLAGELSEDTYPDTPTIPQGCMPSAFIRLFYGQTSISEADIYIDARVLFTVDKDMSTDALAMIDAEHDFIMSTHIVEG